MQVNPRFLFLWLTLLIVTIFLFFVLGTMWYLAPGVAWILFTIWGTLR